MRRRDEGGVGVMPSDPLAGLMSGLTELMGYLIFHGDQDGTLVLERALARIMEDPNVIGDEGKFLPRLLMTEAAKEFPDDPERAGEVYAHLLVLMSHEDKSDQDFLDLIALIGQWSVTKITGPS